MEITRKRFDRLWAEAGGERGASDARLARRLLADSDLMDQLGCMSELYISLAELPCASWQSEDFATWKEETEGTELLAYLREAFDSVVEGGSYDADKSPGVAFIGVEAADGDGEMVAVLLQNGYSFTEVTTRVFGFFRSTGQAEKALRAGGFIASGLSGADLTDEELLAAWGG